MSRHAKVTPLSAKDKEYLEARNQSAKYFNPTTTTTSGAAGESSNMAEDIPEEERRRVWKRVANLQSFMSHTASPGNKT